MSVLLSAMKTQDGGEIRKPLQERTSSSLNIVEDGSDGIRKRKRKYVEVDEGEAAELGGTITILPAGDGSKSFPLVQIIPRLSIQRGDLPLSYLQAGPAKDGSPCVQLFSAHIVPLEGANDAGHVLIVEDCSGQDLHVVERIQRGTYILSRLEEWVRIEDFGRREMKAPRIMPLAVDEKADQPGRWWQAAVTRLPIYSSKEKRREWSNGLVPKLNMQVPRALNVNGIAISEDLSRTLVASHANMKSVSLESSAIPAEATPHVDETGYALEQIRAHYLEALYLSRTSLAYFAKGPLSRARAHFLPHETPGNEIDTLLDYLKGLVMPLTMNDKKYGLAVPTCIKSIPVGLTTEDQDAILFGAKHGKIKKRKKMSKEGLHPGEEEFIAKCWTRREEYSGSGGPTDTRDARIKECISEQRTRETQLQIILILEIMALETTKGRNPTTTVESVVVPFVGEQEQTPVAKKPKRPQDLKTLLDVLADRLCIWQSMRAEEGSRGSEEPSKSQDIARINSFAGNDRLKDFCFEVIVPFYGTRLPDLHLSLCRKLGAGILSPTKAALKRSKSSGKSKEASKKRDSHDKPRKSLERVASDAQVGARRTHAKLSRSSTDSALPSIKKELSEVSLLEVPIATIPALQYSRRREVDLAGVSQATEARLARKQAIDQQLKGAIDAVKKPNGRMAVKEFIDSVDRRAAANSLKGRKSNNPQRNPFLSGVQVMATPKGNRTRDIYGDLPPPGPNTLPVQRIEDPSPPSDPRVPASSIKSVNASSVARTQHLTTPSKQAQDSFRSIALVDQTPSRKSSQLLWPKTRSGQALGTTVEEDEFSQPLPKETPEKAAACDFLSLLGNRTIVSTPIKGLEKRPTPGDLSATPQKCAARPSAGRNGAAEDFYALNALPKTQDETRPLTNDDLIYQTLGWDNELDELI